MGIDWVSYTQIDSKLHEIVSDYESKYGRYELSEWLTNFYNYFECNEQMIRKIDQSPEMTRLSLMYDAYNRTQRDGRSYQGEFGKALRELDPNYESRFGSKKLSEWLEDYADRFKTLENYVYLVR